MATLIWNTLPPEKRDLYLRLLWQDGHSEKAIADFLSATKNQIVGRRNKLKLGNTGRPPRQDIRHEVNPERFQDLLDLNDMYDLADKGIMPLMPPQPEQTEREALGSEEIVQATDPESVTGQSDLPRVVESEEQDAVVPVPAIVVPPPEPEVEQLPTGCQWPLSVHTGQKPMQCGKPVVPGHRLCKEHLSMVRTIR